VITFWRLIFCSPHYHCQFWKSGPNYNSKHKNGHCSAPHISPVFDLLCSPSVHALGNPALWAKCSLLLMEMSSKSPGFIKMLIQAPNLNTANVYRWKCSVSLVQINFPANPLSSEFKEQP